MAAKKIKTTSNEAMKQGMLAPAEGLTALNRFVSFQSLNVGVHGVAPQSYWKLLLRDVMPKPSLFTILYETTDVSEVCTVAFLVIWVPCVHVPPQGLPV